MSNSVNAAKRRRAGPLLTSPLFQPPSTGSKPNTIPANSQMQQQQYQQQQQQLQQQRQMQQMQQMQQQQQLQQQQQRQTQQPQIQSRVPVSTQSRAPVPASYTPTIQETSQRGLTLQQVISQLDTRILYLEKFVIDTRKTTNETIKVVQEGSIRNLENTIIPTIVSTTENKTVNASSFVSLAEVENIVKQTVDEHMSEFSHRYELLASEILNLKFIVMKLQSYTLDVNKTLMDERNALITSLNQDNDMNSDEVDRTETITSNCNILPSASSEPRSVCDRQTPQCINDEVVVVDKEVVVVDKEVVAVIENKEVVAVIDNKEVAVIVDKEVAVIVDKEVAVIENKEVAVVVDNEVVVD